MDIHQCMTCGERWGVGTSADGTRAEKHRLKGHKISVGDAEVLRLQALADGLVIEESEIEPMPMYHCLDCHELWVLGTEDAYQRAIEHKGQGHGVYQGYEKEMRALTKEMIGHPVSQNPNPLDENSVAGGGKILTFSGGA